MTSSISFTWIVHHVQITSLRTTYFWCDDISLKTHNEDVLYKAITSNLFHLIKIHAIIMFTSLKKCSHQFQLQKTELDTSTIIRILLLPTILTILLFIQGTISIFISHDLRTRKFRHELRKENASQIYSRRLQDCNKCFDGEHMQSCNQLVFTCPLFLRYKVTDDSSLKNFESDVKSIYSNLFASQKTLGDNDFYCQGFFTLFISSRNDDCVVDIGSSTEIAVAGVSSIIQKRLDEEYVDTEISHMDWNFIKREISNEGKSLPLYNINIQFNSKMQRNASSTVKNVLSTIRKKHPWSYYFSSVNEVIESRSGFQQTVKIAFTSNERHKPHYS